MEAVRVVCMHCGRKKQNWSVEVGRPTRLADPLYSIIELVLQQAVFLELLSDEVTICANKEKVIVCLRWVVMVHEDSTGLHHVDDITTWKSHF